MDKSHVALLALCDLSAFDMANYEILSQRLEIYFGLSAWVTLLWFRSYYLTGRTLMVNIGDSRTHSMTVKFGVTQDLCLVHALLYLLYTADITLLFSKHLATGFQFFAHNSPAR